jgi:serine phosphatase RsbU (regulator of sigma subunit)/PAS domain-containing protein/anti-sigma regulatory factor (Ser/Thr protein kinase)
MSGSDPERLELAVAAADIGTFDWEIKTGQLFCDERYCEIFGLEPGAINSGIETFYVLVLAEDAGAVMSALDTAVATNGDFDAEFRVRRMDGTVRWVVKQGRVHRGADGTPERMVGVVQDSTELRESRDGIVRTLENMADAFLTVGRGWQVAFANRQTEAMLGLETGTSHGRLLWEIWPSLVSGGHERAFTTAMLSRSPQMFSMYVAESDRWHQLRIVPDDTGLAIFASEISPGRAARLEQHRGLTRPEQARRVLAYSAALAEADTLSDVIEVVGTMVLGAFDAAGMLVMLAESGKLRLAGHAGYDERLLGIVDGVPLEAALPVAQVLHTRVPVFIASPDAFRATYPESAEMVEASGKQAWAFLSLTVSGRSLGSLTISFDRAHEFAPEERGLLVSVAGLLAQTLERARLRDAERTLAAELQRHLLPRALPEPEGLRAAARYLPATAGMDVGGDWYELLELPSGRVGLVIGDVQGHNVRAAAVMGQLRNALRAYAAEGLEPAAVMSRTNRLMADLDPDIFATCCYVVIDLQGRTADVVRAGHPPPLTRDGTGRCGLLETPVGLPLGVDPDETYVAKQIDLAVGDVLVLFTDGLVEDARRSFDSGVEDVVRVLAAAEVDDLEHVAEQLVASARAAEDRPDDIAVLVVCHDGLSGSDRPELVRMSVDRADPRAARTARDFIAGRLSRWDLFELRDTTLLLVSEVVTNALRHTHGEVSIELVRHAGMVRVNVWDQNSMAPTQSPADLLDESGRGIPLVSALSDRWGSAPRGAGKVVWFELDSPPASGTMSG